MSGIKEYVLSAVAAAIVAGVLISLVDSKTTVGVMFRTMAGLFLMFTLLGPVADLDFGDIWTYVEDAKEEGQLAVASGTQAAEAAEMAYIKEEVAAYILDKAETYGASLTVDIILDENGIPVASWIRGRISPYGKRCLQDMMETELGISKEDQRWT